MSLRYETSSQSALPLTTGGVVAGAAHAINLGTRILSQVAGVIFPLYSISLRPRKTDMSGLPDDVGINRLTNLFSGYNRARADLNMSECIKELFFFKRLEEDNYDSFVKSK